MCVPAVFGDNDLGDLGGLPRKEHRIAGTRTRIEMRFICRALLDKTGRAFVELNYPIRSACTVALSICPVTGNFSADWK
jgi:hypothetical protein